MDTGRASILATEAAQPLTRLGWADLASNCPTPQASGCAVFSELGLHYEETRRVSQWAIPKSCCGAHT